MTTSLPKVYRDTLRLQRLLNKNTTNAYDPPYFYEPFFKEYLPKFKQNTSILKGEKWNIFKKKFDCLTRLTQNNLMSKFPLSNEMTHPKGSPHHYSDLVDQLSGKSTPSRKTLLQQFFLKWFRMKIYD